jgi:hypothetical protein
MERGLLPCCLGVNRRVVPRKQEGMLIIIIIIIIIGSYNEKLKEKSIPGKHSLVSIQKTDIPVTSHIIWKVLQCET